MPTKKVSKFIGLPALIALGFILRTATFRADAIRFSSWTLGELVSSLFRVGHNGPLYFLLLRLWRIPTGDSEFAIRFPSAAFGVVAIPLSYLLARQLGYSRRVGLVTALLMATSPYLIWYGQEAKMYTLLLVIVLVAFIAHLRALRGAGWGWWVVFVIATSLSFYIHILSPLMLGVYAAVALLHWPHLRQRWRGWLLSLACLTLPYLPLVWWQAQKLLTNFESGHPFYPLQEEIGLLLQFYSNGLIPTFRVGAMVLFTFLLLAGVFLSAPRRRVRLSLAAWTLLPALLVFFVSLRVPVFEDRYLIYITPAFYLLTAAGLLVVMRRTHWLSGAVLLVALLGLNGAGIWHQQSQPLKADFRAVSTYLQNQAEPPATIMIQIPYLVYTLDYYYPRDYTYIEGLWTNDGRSEAQAALDMQARTAGLDELWLVVSEEAMWDRRQLSRQWLDDNAELVSEAHFMRVSVYHYHFDKNDG